MAESTGAPMPSEPPAGLPTEVPKAKPWGKILAVVIVLIVIIAAIAVWRLGQGVQETQPQITRVDITSGVTGNVGSVGTSIGLRATATGSIGSYEWNFGDGSAVSTTTGNTTSHAYTDDGTYIILVTVKSPGGLTATNDNNLVQIVVLDTAFVPADNKVKAVASVIPSAVVLTGGSATVTANGSASHGFTGCPDACIADTAAITTWTWTWGDGTADGTQSDMTHAFNAVGNYAVKLRVTNATNNAADTTYMTVRVSPAAVSLVKNPGVLVIASIGDPEFLDPAIDYETAGGEIIKNVYDRLVKRPVDFADPANPVIRNDQFVGSLAESWTISPSGLVWNFTIRQGVAWQAPAYGTLTPADVEFSLRRVLVINSGPAWILDQYLTDYASDDPLTPTINERWEAINASVVATDSRHVELRLARPYGAVLQTLDFEVASIVSKQWILDNGGLQWETDNAYANRNMMGTGPYKLDHWTPGVELKLVKSTTYWGTPKPKLDAVLWRQVPEPATQELLLKNGDVDWAEGIPTRDINTVMTWQGVVVKQNPGLVVQYMGMVEDNSWPGDTLRTVNTSPFQDLHVRKAVSYAFDYNTLLTEILDSWGTQLKSGIPQGMPGWNGGFWNYNTNIATAQAELAQAAPPWNAGGFSVNLSYNSGNPVRAQIATMVQAQLAQIGIDVNIQAVSWPAHLNNMDFRRSELVLIGWAPDYLDPDDYLYPLFHSAACPVPRADPTQSTRGTNVACYKNPIVDSALDNASREPDWSKRLENYTVAQQYIVQEAAWVFMYQPTDLDPIRTWVKGYYFDPMALKDYQALYKA